MAGSIAVVAVVAIVRLPTESMWVDEAFTQAAVQDISTQLEASRASMVGYMPIVWLWARVSTEIWWLRLVSVIAAVCTLALLRPVARWIGGSRLVLAALPATALLVGFQWTATTARSYALVTLLTVAAWYCLLAGTRRTESGRARKWWRMLAVVSLFGLALHALFILQLIPVAILTIVRLGLRRALRALGWTIAVTVAGVAMYALVGTRANGIYTPGGLDSYIGALLDAFYAPNALIKLLLLQLTLIALVFVYVQVRSGGIGRNWKLLIPGAWAFGPPVLLALVSIIEPINGPRYVLPSLPGVGLLLGLATVTIADAMERRHILKRKHPLVCTVPMLVLLTAAAVTTPYPTSSDWRGVVAVVADGAAPGDAIVFADAEGQFPQFTRPAFEATWGEHDRPVEPTPLSPVRPLGNVQARDQLRGPTAIAAQAPLFARIWFIQDRDAGVPDHIVEITKSEMMADFSHVDSWTFEPSIQVELWAQKSTGGP